MKAERLESYEPEGTLPPSGGSRNGDPAAKGTEWWRAVLVVEAVALMIALVTPITPSKTGSTWSPANMFWAEPSYLQEVGASFVVVNLMMLVIALAVWIVARLGSSSD